VTRREVPDLLLARIYDWPGAERHRVLVDGLWPRGVKRNEAAIDEWCRDIAPSATLRKWYGHEPRRFAEFAERYRQELTEPSRTAACNHLLNLARSGPLTLVTATRAMEFSHAAVLSDLLTSRF
jgi:uncharacterized protein YeaO (DUF488 family)